MIDSILNVHKNFFGLFQNITLQGKKIPCRYARKSSADYSEEQSQQTYPCIAIQDYPPTLDDRGYVDLREYQGSSNLLGNLIELVKRPMWMNFRFDVSIAAKHYFEYNGLQNYFYQKFLSRQQFVFNSTDLSDINEGEVGDVVPYTMSITDIPRNDGIFEANFEFTLYVWLQITDIREVAAIDKISVGVSTMGKDEKRADVYNDDYIYHGILDDGDYDDTGTWEDKKFWKDNN